MPSPQVIFNAFWLVTVKVLNSYTFSIPPEFSVETPGTEPERNHPGTAEAGTGFKPVTEGTSR